jgi:hypothetical protein
MWTLYLLWSLSLLPGWYFWQNIRPEINTAKPIPSEETDSTTSLR